jgi:hypothetical protein
VRGYCVFRRRPTANPTQDRQTFRGKADSNGSGFVGQIVHQKTRTIGGDNVLLLVALPQRCANASQDSTRSGETPPEIGHAGRDPHLRSRRQRNHRSKPSTAVRTHSGSAAPFRRAPLVTTTCISRDGRSLTSGHTHAYFLLSAELRRHADYPRLCSGTMCREGIERGRRSSELLAEHT